MLDFVVSDIRDLDFGREFAHAPPHAWRLPFERKWRDKDPMGG